MNLADAQAAVTEFHRAKHVPIAERPALLSGDPQRAAEFAAELRGLQRRAGELASAGELFGRLSLTLEELAEWLEAHASGDLRAAADALGDRLYVLLGDAVATGLPSAQIFAAVHASNMTKVACDKTGISKPSKGGEYETPRLDGMLSTRLRSRPDLPHLPARPESVE